MTEKNRFMLWYYDQDDYNDEILTCVEVLAPADTLAKILTGNEHFYMFVIDDGQKLIIAANRIHCLKQII